MANVKEINEAAATWFAKCDSGTWTEEDQKQFESWIDADLSHRIAYIRMKAVWKKAHRLKALGAGIAEGSVPAVGEWNYTPASNDRSVAQKLYSPKDRRKSLIAGAMLAAAILLMAIGAIIWPDMLRSLPEYHTPVGGVATVPLNDGSTVVLNTDSAIKVALSTRSRTIKLPRGEVYFDVAKDADRPFIVEAGSNRIVALGTKFSVWYERDRLRVAVTQGLVRVENTQRGFVSPIHLHPGEVALDTMGKLSIEHKAVELIDAEYLSWRNGYVVFNETPLNEALDQINRYNHEKIILTDPALMDLKIGGTFRATNIHAFLRLLEQGLSLQAVREGNRIILQPGESG